MAPTRKLTKEQLKERNRLAMQAKRKDPAYKERERVAQRERRADPDYQEREREAQRERRADPEVQEREREAQRERRADPEVQEREREAQRERRADPEVQERERVAQRKRRADPEVQERERVAQRKRMADPEAQERERVAQKKRMADPEVRERHRITDAACHTARRKDPAVRQKEAVAKKLKGRNNPWPKVHEACIEAIKEGPILTCFSCDRLWFKRSVVITSEDKIVASKNLPGMREYLVEAILSDHYAKEKWVICRTCHRSIVQKKVPRFNINFRNLKFPKIDKHVKMLGPLERRLVAPRIPFMKIFALGCDRQFGIRGGVINVPVDVPGMFRAIPIHPNQANVIHLKLKKKNIYHGHYMYERVRPKLIFAAAKALCETPLYKSQDPPITVDQNWDFRDLMDIPFDAEWDTPISDNLQSQFGQSDAEEPMDVDNTAQDIPMDTDEPQNPPSNETEQNNDDADNDDNNHFYEETLIDNTHVVTFAPGEGQTPLAVWHDDNCEELSFPHIYGGHARDVQKLGPNDRKLSYNEISKSELLRSDRRAVEPDHLFFQHKKIQLEQLHNAVGIQMRRSAQANVTAGLVISDGWISDAIAKDYAFRVLQNIVGSPAYWEQQKKKVLAMVRQFGIPTFFITLSAAETKWEDLLKILLKTVDGVDATDEDVKNLPFEKRAELIRKDPITCARYFDNRFKEVKSTWYHSNEGPFGEFEVEHMYHRIEFQHRGSPHVHMLVWLKGAPQYKQANNENENEQTNEDNEEDQTSNEEKIIQFIDSIVTTNSEDPDMQDFIPLQTHNCKPKSCYKKCRGKQICRFGAPFPPMKQTMILTPLDNSEVSPEEKKELKEKAQKLKDVLQPKVLEVTTFEELYEKVGVKNDEEYIKVVRSTINVNKVMVKRAVKDTRINPFSKKIIQCMQSNMDIQFILDPYACISYIVEYINKPARGISRLLRACVDDVRAGNEGIHRQLQCVCNCFYNSCEICAQEAAWCRCGLLMSVCGVIVDFINTSRSEKRHRMMKTMEELKELPRDSTDVFKRGMIDRYAARPQSMENVCLADFIANYTFKGKKGSAEANDEGTNENIIEDENNDNGAQPDIANEDEIYNKGAIPLSDGTLHRRKKPKVIRFCRFNILTEPNEFLRERLMLFKPWRDEKVELEAENMDYEAVFNEEETRKIVKENAKKYIKVDIDIEKITEIMEEFRNLEEDTFEDEINTDYVNEYEPDENLPEPNVFDEGQNGIEAKKYSLPDRLSDDDYLALCDSLNEKQKDYLMFILNSIKTSNDPQYHFISGGAGVGKSRLIKALYQTLIRYYQRDAGPAGNVEVALIAPTGKAAHGIGGETAHHFFNIQFGSDGNSENYVPPNPDRLNTFRTELADLKVVIIDEISMMGSKTLNKIHLTLNHVFVSNNTNQIFGNRSVIVFGDFNQLPPVKDRFCFLNSSKNLLNVVAGNVIWKKFKMFELTEIMRQREDVRFAEALNRLAVGESTDDDMVMFNEHVYSESNGKKIVVQNGAEKIIKPELPEEGKKAIRLAWANDDVKHYNNRRLNQFKTTLNPTQYVTNKAVDTFPNDMSPRIIRQIKNNLQGKSAAETHGLPDELELLIGAHYMISSNIDVSDGLFNGAIGILRKFETVQQNQKTVVSKVFLEFDDPAIGKVLRSRNRVANNQNPLWTPLKPVKITFAVTRSFRNKVTRKQFPLVVAEGITIHKSQGCTFENVTVQVPAKNIRSLVYVALSRATRLENLFMVEKMLQKTNPPKPDDLVVKEMNRLRADAFLEFKFVHLRKVPSDCIQIVSQNIRSVKKHINTVRKDPVFTSSKFILLQETWLGAEADLTNVEIPDFSIITRNENRSSAGNGTMIYGSDNVIDSVNVDREDINSPIDITALGYKDMIIINMYRSSKASVQNLEIALGTIKNQIKKYDNVVLLGDFNTKINETNNRTRKYLLEEYNLEYLSPKETPQPTTDNHSTIDGAFGKLANYTYETFIYESYCSDHKPVVLRLTMKPKSTGLSQTLRVLDL